MKTINLTPHEITIFRVDDRPFTVPPSGTIARVSMDRFPAPGLPQIGVACYFETPGDVYGVPEPEEMEPNTIYLVSRMVLDALITNGDPRRFYCFAPDTGAGAVRDAGGRIVGVRSLIRAP